MMAGDILSDREARDLLATLQFKGGDILTSADAKYIRLIEGYLNAMRDALRDIAAATTTDGPDVLGEIQGICRRALAKPRK